jgi:archaeal type IV pilus assembly protein PilA
MRAERFAGGQNMKKIWAVRRDTEAVSPVIATILMVAITVVLAAVLYVMVLGFGSTNTQTPAATYQKTTDATYTNGARITILSITNTQVSWNDVKIQLSDGTNFAEWSPVSTNLDGGSAVSSNLSSDTLGALTVYCIVFDVSGNGYISGSDYFIVWATSFSSATTYSAVLIYDPSGEKMGTGATFTG